MSQSLWWRTGGKARQRPRLSRKLTVGHALGHVMGAPTPSTGKQRGGALRAKPRTGWLGRFRRSWAVGRQNARRSDGWLGRLRRSWAVGRTEACGARGSLAGASARIPKRLRRTRSRAGINTSLRAPQPVSWRAESDSAKQRRLGPRPACRSDAHLNSPSSTLRASLGCLRHTVGRHGCRPKPSGATGRLGARPRVSPPAGAK